MNYGACFKALKEWLQRGAIPCFFAAGSLKLFRALSDLVKIWVLAALSVERVSTAVNFGDGSQHDRN